MSFFRAEDGCRVRGDLEVSSDFRVTGSRWQELTGAGVATERERERMKLERPAVADGGQARRSRLGINKEITKEACGRKGGDKSRKSGEEGG